MNIAGEIAVVTGGASGIGRATALALARAGADVAIADVHEQRLAEVGSEIAALGRRVLALRCDVSVDRDVQALAARVEAELGPPGVGMNKAGVVLRGALEETELADWQRAFGSHGSWVI